VADDNDERLDPAEIESLMPSTIGVLSPSGERRRQGDAGGEISSERPAISESVRLDSVSKDGDRHRPRHPDCRENQLSPEPVDVFQQPVDLEAVLTDRMAEARPYELPSFDTAPAEGPGADALEGSDADVELQIELGRAVLPAEEEGSLREGTVVSLDKLAGDPVDILIDGRLIARGEVLVIHDKLCIRVAEILGSSFVEEQRAELVYA
jgi:flagellar motor switch protein FliN